MLGGPTWGGSPALLGTLKALSAQEEDSLSIHLGQASIYDMQPHEQLPNMQ